MHNSFERETMKRWFVATGIVLLMIGLTIISVARTPEVFTTKREEEVKRVDNSAEITDVPLNKDDKFLVSYSGGTTVSVEEIDIVIYDPFGNETTVPYFASRRGIIANYTGLYRMKLVGVFTNPTLPPLVVTVRKIIENTRIEYPNSNMVFVGYPLLVIGGGVSLWGVKSPKRKAIKKMG